LCWTIHPSLDNMLLLCNIEMAGLHLPPEKLLGSHLKFNQVYPKIETATH